MRADNWAVCPRCLAKAKKKKNDLIEKAEKDYGKIPVGEYLELVEKSKKPIEQESSLREDYEFYLSVEGHFTAKYSCRCDCGFSFKFKHEEELESSIIQKRG